MCYLHEHLISVNKRPERVREREEIRGQKITCNSSYISGKIESDHLSHDYLSPAQTSREAELLGEYFHFFLTLSMRWKNLLQFTGAKTATRPKALYFFCSAGSKWFFQSKFIPRFHLKWAKAGSRSLSSVNREIDEISITLSERWRKKRG